MKLGSLKIFELSEFKREILNEFHNMDIFFLPEYVMIFEKFYNEKGFYAYYEINGSKLLKPFIKLKINNKNYYDIVTPYGVGGFIFEIKNISLKDLFKKFYKDFSTYLYSENVISEFTRIHPFFYSEDMKLENFITNFVTYSVFIKLNENLKIRKGHYALIKSAKKNKIEIKVSREKKDIEIFYHLYIETMKRKRASSFYFFPFSFIEDFFKYFNESYVIVAFFKEKPIAASMFLGYNKFFHYFLSGSDYNYSKYGGSHLIIYEAINFAKKKGFEILHLGGGMKGKDSLFLFKSGFSDFYMPYYVYGVIHNEKIYLELLEERKKMGPLPSEFFFPLYRAPL
ncbi:MAG: GNAT family N-acetyltransferase [Candidatus Hydrothermales bacterium]